MKLPDTVRLLIVTSTTLAVAAMRCPLGSNACDSSNSIIIVCGSRGWTVAEVCQDDACRLGPRGTAYCQKEVDCIPGRSQCDTTNYFSRFCNELGIRQTDRKCSKPGCCEVRSGWAACKVECGPGLPPPAQFPSWQVPTKARRIRNYFSVTDGDF